MGIKKADRVLLAVAIDGKNYAYYGRKVIYKDLGSITGVKEGTASTDYEPDFSLPSFLRSGRITYINCATNAGKTYRVLCATDNLKTALGNLKKKQIDSSPINTASIPQRQYLR